MTDFEKDKAVIEVTAEVTTLQAFAASYPVATPAQFEAGAEDLKRVKAAQKRLEDTRTGITGPMNAALKKVNDFFRSPADLLARAEKTIKGSLGRYTEEQERIRREEQRRADEAAAAERRKAEAAAAEERRKAEEQAAELRRKAEAAAAAGRAAEAAKFAERAEAKVEKADIKAAALEQKAATVVAPVIQREPPKVANIAARQVWKFEVTDPASVPREFLSVDEARIRKVVQALKGDAKIAGVRVYPETQISAGAA